MNSDIETFLERYDFDLPSDQIARFPTPRRIDARILQVKDEQFFDGHMCDLPKLLQAGDRLVVNDTKVMHARIHTHRKTGGAVEILITKLIDDQHCRALIRPSRRIKQGEIFSIEEDHTIQCLSRDEHSWILSCTPSVHAIMQKIGEIPIPPYFNRKATAEDETRYQSRFAKNLGAVAASTASLHLSDQLISELKDKGVSFSTITLHIGMGTFAPLRAEQIIKKKLHSEWFSLSQQTVDDIAATKRNGGRVIAVGTTVTRCLEAAAQEGELCAKKGETDIFIQEDFSFRVIDGLLTNFHLPKSSLLMLVCAFGGKETIMQAYQHAITQQYRFYSYGDAMLIWPSVAEVPRS